METKLIRIDKNGTSYYGSNICPKCHGTGVIDSYKYYQAGVCFKCDGTGKFYHEWKEYTHEYLEKKHQRDLKKRMKKAEELNKQFFEARGFNESGEAFIVLGNTFEIKEDLKKAGARFDKYLKWHFKEEQADFPTVKITCEQIYQKDEAGVFTTWLFNNGLNIDTIVKRAEAEMNKKTSKSEWVGEVKDRITVDVKFVKLGGYATHYTYYGEVVSIFTFQDANGNEFVWKTSSFQDIELGGTYTIKGTIKAHSEYNGIKQTELTRCKVVK